jgi:hypothetical protein
MHSKRKTQNKKLDLKIARNNISRAENRTEGMANDAT